MKRRGFAPGALLPRPIDLERRARLASAPDVLEFERQWPDWASEARQEAIWQAFGVSPVRYMQRLRSLVMQPASLPLDPQTVRRVLDRFAAAGDRRAELAAEIRAMARGAR